MAQSRHVVFTNLLIGLILFAFAFGAFRVNQQARQINDIVASLSPLVFSFEGAPTETNQKVVVVITCEKPETSRFYVCITDQPKKP